jgi:hypothetical protein
MILYTKMFLNKDIVNYILEYYGRIKYDKGKYINVIHKYDERYKMLEPLITNKSIIMSYAERGVNKRDFYFEVDLSISGLCLVYDMGFLTGNEFQICYVDLRNGWTQIRTII